MKKFSLILFMMLCLALAACSNDPHENHKNHEKKAAEAVQQKQDLNWEVQSFTYKDQDNKQFASESLKGKVWIANFIFTNCETVCPPMTAHMSKLQDMTKKEKMPVEFVSFSVDPKRDTPKELVKFGKMYQADFKNWTFLTGYKKETIEKLAKDSFKMAVSTDPSSDQFIHGSSLFLVDKKGKIVQRYSGVQDTPFKQMIKDIKKQNSI